MVPSISIVIPVYNCEKYLDDCLISVYNQDTELSEFEVICVNDGSSDSSLAILENYKSKYSNLKIISQENKGHAVARNTGLAAAVGKYVWFVDSDDVIEKNSISKIVDTMEKNEIDFLTIGLTYFDSNKNYENLSLKMHDFKLTINKKISRKICCSGPRIFSRKILVDHSIKWNDNLTCDDFLFVFQVQCYCQKSRYVKQLYYFCRETPNSASRIKSAEHAEKSYHSSKQLLEIYCNEFEKTENAKLKKEIAVRKNQIVQSLLLQAAMSRNSDEIKFLLDNLKYRKLYPYKLIYCHLLYRGNINNTIMNYICFLFPIESYYRLICKIFKMRHN